MQRIVNDPARVVDDMLKGFARRTAIMLWRQTTPASTNTRAHPRKPRSGLSREAARANKPAFIGYVGRNMLDAVAVGAGDTMNVKMAMELAAEAGMRVTTVIANDDVPSAPKIERENRRGVAGEVLMWKAAGARAARGGPAGSGSDPGESWMPGRFRAG
jgi:dihydroxyacetone kinase-like protein